MLRQLFRPFLGAYLSDVLHLRDDIINYRLTPYELNSLLHQLAITYVAHIAVEDINTFHCVELNGKKFVICPMSKDSESENNEIDLPFIWDVVRQFYARNPAENDQNCVLLLPLRLCRGYLKLPTQVDIFKRKHAVLIELDLATQTLEVHDSQDGWRWVCYPDKITQRLNVLNQITGVEFKFDPQQHYHAYNTQNDDYSCGYFVYFYVRAILAAGNSADLAKINFSVSKDYKNKHEFLCANGLNMHIDPRDLEFDDISDEGIDIVNFHSPPKRKVE